MKAKFLKLAGVKNEEEFYKKFPTEEAFMAKHGAKVKKMMFSGSETKTDTASTTTDTTTEGPYNYDSLFKAAANSLPGLIAGIKQVNQQNKDIAAAEQWGKVRDVLRQIPKPQLQKMEYARPEDLLTNSINPLGTGTSYLVAANGAEIQNTYAPDVIYTDLGYEPLSDSTKTKA